MNVALSLDQCNFGWIPGILCLSGSLDLPDEVPERVADPWVYYPPWVLKG